MSALSEQPVPARDDDAAGEPWREDHDAHAAIKHPHIRDLATVCGCFIDGHDAARRETYCAYCGFAVPFDDHAASGVSEHIRTCPKHPMRLVEDERDTARRVLKEYRHTAEREIEELRERAEMVEPLERRLAALTQPDAGRQAP